MYNPVVLPIVSKSLKSLKYKEKKHFSELYADIRKTHANVDS